MKEYKPIICPVCGEFYFSELTNEDIEFGDDGFDRVCFQCGWKYDIEQIKDLSLRGKNGYSIDELKTQYQIKKAKNDKFSFLLETAPKKEKHLCPVCKQHVFKELDSHDICPICNWEDDFIEEKYGNGGGANGIPLNDYIIQYLKSKQK